MGAQQALIVWFKKRVYSRSCKPSFFMVPKAGVEPARPKAQPPQDCVSASSTTSALINEGHTMCGTQCVHIYNFLQLKSLVFAAN